MDFRARDRAWSVHFDNVLNDHNKDTTNDVNSPNCDILIFKYKELLKRRLRICWNRALLSKYLDRDMIPRGLRVQIFPSFPVEDPSFRERWECLAQTCSLGFLSLLKEHNTTTLSTMEVELEELEKTIKSKCTADAVLGMEAEIEKELSKLEKEVCGQKLKKFNRDLGDYASSTAYRWQTRSRTGPRGRTISRGQSASLSSLTSLGESSEASGGGSEAESSVGARVKTTRNKQQATRQGGRNRLQVINLSSHVLSNDQLEVLSRGLTFSPVNNFDFFTALKDTHLFARKLILKKFHHRRDNTGLDSPAEREALQVLEDLLEEQSSATVGTHNDHWQTMREILSKHWPVLRSDPVLADVLPPGPLMTARRSKNLRDILVRSHYVPPIRNPFTHQKRLCQFKSLLGLLSMELKGLIEAKS
ncbi:uncharacterized protein ACNLHF_009208 [Anomaloglossus baeobatrachus]